MSDLEDQLAEAFRSGFQAGERASLDGEVPSSYGGDKATKAEANYREADDVESCDTCIHFDANDHSCDVVSGVIRPTAVSDYYEPMKGSKSAGE